MPIFHITVHFSIQNIFEEVCARRGIPFVDTFEPLRNHEQWMNDVNAAGRDHPGQAGYGLLAWLVLHRGWYEWLGVEQPD